MMYVFPRVKGVRQKAQELCSSMYRNLSEECVKHYNVRARPSTHQVMCVTVQYMSTFQIYHIYIDIVSNSLVFPHISLPNNFSYIDLLYVSRPLAIKRKTLFLKIEQNAISNRAYIYGHFEKIIIQISRKLTKW